MTRFTLEIISSITAVLLFCGCGDGFLDVFGGAKTVTEELSPGSTDCAGYPEKRVFLEAQGWWTPSPGTSGMNDFGHVHVGTCFPLEQRVSGVLDFDIRIVMHDNPGVLHSIRPHIAGSGFNNSSPGTIRINETCPAGETCAFWIHTQMDTNVSPKDGRQEFRFLTSVKEPDGQELHVSTGWQADIRNGKPVDDYRAANFLEGRGWYTGADYEVARLSSPFPFEPVSGAFDVKVDLKRGSGGIPATHHSVLLDPNFHMNNPGTTLLEGTGEFRGTITVPGGLTPGMHKLVLKTDADCAGGNCGSENDGQRVSGLIVLPFEVAGDGSTQPAPDPEPAPEPEPTPDPDPTPEPPPAPAPGEELTLNATADAHVRSGEYADENYGSSTALEVKDGGDNYDREAYLSFDLAGFDLAGFTRAALTLDVSALPNGSPVTLEIGLAPAFDVDESGLTWSTRPSDVEVLQTATVSSAGSLRIDLGVLPADLGTHSITLVVRTRARENRMVRIRSREYGLPPTLVLQ